MEFETSYLCTKSLYLHLLGCSQKATEWPSFSVCYNSVGGSHWQSVPQRQWNMRHTQQHRPHQRPGTQERGEKHSLKERLWKEYSGTPGKDIIHELRMIKYLQKFNSISSRRVSIEVFFRIFLCCTTEERTFLEGEDFTGIISQRFSAFYKATGQQIQLNLENYLKIWALNESLYDLFRCKFYFIDNIAGQRRGREREREREREGEGGRERGREGGWEGQTDRGRVPMITDVSWQVSLYYRFLLIFLVEYERKLVRLSLKTTISFN